MLQISSEGRNYLEVCRNNYRLLFMDGQLGVSLLRVINIINQMQITFLNLEETDNIRLRKMPVNLMDSCQRKIKKMQKAFVIKAFGSHIQQRINATNRRELCSTRKRRIATTVNDSSPQKEIVFLEPSPKALLLNRKAGQPRIEKIDLDTIDRGNSSSLKLAESLNHKTSSKGKTKKKQEVKSVNIRIITDRLSSQLRTIRRQKTRLTRGNKSELLFSSQNAQSTLRCSSTDRMSKDLYFERAPIIRFSSKKHPQYKSMVEALYQDKMEKDILLSQRSALLRSIRDQVTNLNAPSKRKISRVLSEAKQSELLKAVIRRKSELTSNLSDRKFNPYYSYMNMSQKARKQFISKDKVLDMDNLDKDLDNLTESRMFE